MEKPIIKYPCKWSYRIIGQDEQLLRNAVLNVVADKKHQLSYANESSGGKYKSLNLEITVQSEKEKLEIFDKIKSNKNVKFVL
jgi:putative lipoic acid-binding regulatory protein